VWLIKHRKELKGTAVLQYLLLGLIIGGIALTISGAISTQLAATHNSGLQTIQDITGGGF